jgi:hypothetical protein
MNPLSPADELAEIRTEIRQLRLREALLRQHILKDPGVNSLGRWHRVEVEEHLDLILDISRLPAEILQDRNFWQEKRVQTLRCLPAAAPVQRRPGWPIRRETAQLVH